MYVCIYIYIYIHVYIYIYIYIYTYIHTYISSPWGDRKFGGCFYWACLGGDFGESELKE